MPAATIIPAYINAPKPGAKSGSIKDQNGDYWGLRPEDMSQFAVGVPAEIVYTEREYQGRVYKNIQTLKSPHSTGQHPGPAPALKPPQTNGVGFRPSMAPKDAQEARISLLCQAYAQAGIVPSAQDVETLVMNVTRGVANATPKLTSPQHAEDMDDSIPY
jgi:hypothetical protein